MSWDLAWFAAGLAVLTTATLVLGRLAGLGLGWAVARAMARAVLQLSVVALLLRGILSVPATVIAFVVLMLSVASVTSMSRLREVWCGRRAAATGVVTGSVLAIGAVFALGLVEVQARYVIAIAGIVIGNAMNAATLSGRNFRRAARDRTGEVEAWLSLGATPAQAHLRIGQEAARETLIPTLDQTRSTGLVTLPGAFVGALFGGASPLVAAQFQLTVLAGIALAMTTTSIVVTRWIGRTPYVEPLT